MMTGKQKRYLRSLAHSLKPVVQIGKQGLSRETLIQIEKQLDDHELIKVRVLEASPQDHRECNQALEKNESFEVVQLIGKLWFFIVQGRKNQPFRFPNKF